MKKIICYGIMYMLFMGNTLAQTPENFNYQAALRNSSGELIVNQNVSVKLSILQESTTGTPVYSETHTVQTTDNGLINIKVGNGENKTGDIATIDWGAFDYFLKVEIDEAGGSEYISVGTSQLLSVPYALYSKNAESSKAAINADSASVAKKLDEEALYFTETDTLFAVKDRDGNIVFAVFPDGAKVYVNETVKGNIGGFAVSGRNPGKAVETDIFTVTADSTRVFVNEAAKGSIGGFAVSGRNPGKAGTVDILTVTSDSTRVFINKPVKGSIGGFAVSGRNPGKAEPENYLQINADSTRIFVKDSVAGFGVANLQSGNAESFLNLNKQNYFIGHQTGAKNKSGVYNIMVGYESGYSNQSGSYNTFLGFQSGYLNNASYNSFIGYLSGKENSSGAYNTFIGYESGKSNLAGDNNVFLGHQTGFSNTNGHENVFIGYRSGYSNTSGYDNIFIGNLAGENASGNTHSTFIGNEAGKNVTGDDNIYIGDRAGTNAYVTNHESFGTVILGIDAGRNVTGEYNTVLGYGSGSSWGGESTGSYNTFVGTGAGGGGSVSRLGSYNVCLGNDAGAGKTGSYKLYIDISDTSTPLIYGNFLNDSIIINGNLHVTGNITSDGTTVVPDYVFDNSYELESIEEHADFMWNQKHLPALKSAGEIQQEGKINLNERREQMLEELEKAHIYIEQLHNRIKELETKVNNYDKLENEINELRQIITSLSEE